MPSLGDLSTSLFLVASEGGVSITAQPYFENLGFLSSLTNSIFVALLVLAIIFFAVRSAMKDVRLVPSGAQNAVEFVVEFLYGQVEQVVGKQVAPRAFPLLATLFIYILVANWFGLLPGVGTIGLGSPEHQMPYFGLTHEPEVPLLRPATADVNLTLGISVCFMIVWFFITMKEAGPVQFLKHMFAPKGGLTGLISIVLVPIFFFVGIIEMVSIIFRPVSLSLRLFGNIFAGENLLHTMGSLGEQFGMGPIASFVSSIALPLPFYFMELLVGVLQAMVFSLLCAVYIQLSTAHDEEEHH